MEELQRLLEDHQQVTTNVNALVGLIEDGEQAHPDVSMPKLLVNIQEQLTAFVRPLYRHKRKAATNVYVLMISSELRRSKPYAVPIQLLPYKSINERTMRNIVSEILQVMVTKGMKVIGKFN